MIPARKLSADQVRTIRSSSGTHADVSRLVGVSPSLIGQIKRYEIYRDVEDVPTHVPEPEPDLALKKGDLVRLKSGGPTMTIADTSLLGTLAVVYAVDGTVRTATLGEMTVERVTE